MVSPDDSVGQRVQQVRSSLFHAHDARSEPERVRILAPADDQAVTAGRLPDAEEEGLVLGPHDADRSASILLGVLVGRTPACHAARDAVLAGGACRIGGGLVPAGSLAGTYSVRLEHTRAKGIETVGLPESLRALKEYGGEPVRLGFVDSPDSSWHFVVFISADGSSLVAVTGVRQRRS
ncbi:hypothetical protein ACGF0D_39290 [Kitasatospora sp. NPDC048298]|uniref:hypothetical protein n=1 Tax=Kitasatospora sp. NPDC048298 TaxID=3364049 RepID=UPI003720BFC1